MPTSALRVFKIITSLQPANNPVLGILLFAFKYSNYTLESLSNFSKDTLSDYWSGLDSSLGYMLTTQPLHYFCYGLLWEVSSFLLLGVIPMWEDGIAGGAGDEVLSKIFFRKWLFSRKAKAAELLGYPGEKRQQAVHPEQSPGWTTGFHSVVTGNDKVLLVSGIYNGPTEDKLPSTHHLSLLYSHCPVTSPKTLQFLCWQAKK